MIPTRARRWLAGGCCLALATVTGCTPLAAPGRTPFGRDHDAIVAALAARERARDGLRLSTRVRAAGAGISGLAGTPAYLALDHGDHLRLQVLSPFGATVLELEVVGRRYRLRLPLSGQSRRGRIDVAALTDSAAPPGERMIVAMALLFRPKARPESCAPAGPRAVRCSIGQGLTATITVDERLRPAREAIDQTDGAPLLVADYAWDSGGGGDVAPAHVTIHDAVSDATMSVRVVRARIVGAGGGR